MNRLVNERNEWIAHNFPGDTLAHSVEGVIEELGEFVHHRLKMTQRVRGRGPFHLSEMQDAVGDMVIFLLGVMSRCGIPKSGQVPYPWAGRGIEDAPHALRLAVLVGNLAFEHKSHYSLRRTCWDILHELNEVCTHYGWDLRRLVLETWEAVKQRDWVRYPENGLDR